MSKSPKKIVLAYSGGLDTSVILPWLKNRHPGCEVVAFAAELGQGSELEGVEKKARESGADDVVVADLREEFARDYCFPMLRAHAIYERDYLLGTSIARPLIAAKQVEAARQTDSDAVAHGATGKGNDQVRFELTFMALAPDLQIISPWKDPTFELRDREAAIEYAHAARRARRTAVEKIYSQDRNLWHISHEGAEIEDPAGEPKWERMLTMTSPIGETPNEVERVTVEFEHGDPVSSQRREAQPGGADREDEHHRRPARRGCQTPRRKPPRRHEVTRRLRDTRRHRPLRCPQCPRTAHARTRPLSGQAEGQPRLRPASSTTASGSTRCATRCRRLSMTARRSCTGEVTLSLYKGTCDAIGVKSPFSLYDPELASFSMDGYDVTAARGFIDCFGLPMKVAGMRARRDA